MLSMSILLLLYPSSRVWSDYQDLLNHENTVRLSLITLWVPIGFLGASMVMFFQASKALIYGKKINEILSESTMKITNKICIYSALLGIVFAIFFAIYSISLLDEYGYKYSSELTRITPTGIHLIYLKEH